MANNYVFNDILPVAPLKLAALESCKDLATKVNDHDVDSYLLDCKCPRFGSGEAKAVINESVRGADLFAMVDVTNYSIPYSVCGYTNHMSPDDHFQDLKRVIAAAAGKARRINVIMPFPY